MLCTQNVTSVFHQIFVSRHSDRKCSLAPEWPFRKDRSFKDLCYGLCIMLQIISDMLLTYHRGETLGYKDWGSVPSEQHMPCSKPRIEPGCLHWYKVLLFVPLPLLGCLLQQIINIYLSDCRFAQWGCDECPCVCRLSNTKIFPPHWSLWLWNIIILKQYQPILGKEQRRHVPAFSQ